MLLPDLFNRFLVFLLNQILWGNLLFFDLFLQHFLRSDTTLLFFIFLNLLWLTTFLFLLLLRRGSVLSVHERLELDIEHFDGGQAATFSKQGMKQVSVSEGESTNKALEEVQKGAQVDDANVSLWVGLLQGVLRETVRGQVVKDREQGWSEGRRVLRQVEQGTR